MATARALRLVTTEPVVVEVPEALLVAAIDNAAALADDLFAGIDAVAFRLFAGNRAAALNELGRLHHRVEGFAEAFAELDPIPDRGPSTRRPA